MTLTETGIIDKNEKVIAIEPAHGSAVPNIVEFRDVTKIFNVGTPKESVALCGLTAAVPDLPGRGEFVAIVGPSGCGKSTALNLVAGFHRTGPPTSGEVLVRGKRVTEPGADRGMIFQKYSSFPHLTVFENVCFGLNIARKKSGQSSKQIAEIGDEWIEKVGLAAHRNKYPHQLSGGQQQRIAIARTLVMKPRIVLMDEPFSALDEPTRIEMQKLVVCLWEEVEATVFIVTHSITEAVYLGDRVWVFGVPGHIVKEVTDLHIPSSMEDPLDVQKSAAFAEKVEEVAHVFGSIGK
jgi:ABC-type nitrate/sulfonate/bicarbonate transport system ATPase subunit